jgi:hypothetical protein
MTPNDDTHDQELLARYRRASDADAAGPSDAVRAAILAESRRVAEEFAKPAPRQPFDVSRPAANDSRWKIPAFGTLGAALLAALLFAPRYWENAPPPHVSMPPPPAAASAAAQVQAKAEAPKLEELKSDAAPSYSAPARQSRSQSDSLQEVVVTGADHKKTAPPRAQNYAPVSPSFSSLAAAPPELAARARARDLSAQAGDALKPATLESAVAQADVGRAASLLDQGAVIDARDAAGRTPLMLAVTQDRLEIVRLLLARGADPNAADNAGHTPLQQATKRNLQDVAALLEQAGAH